MFVTTAAEAAESIHRYQEQMAKSVELQERAPYARAWYALPKKGGGWVFAPSKWTGYYNLSSGQYLDKETPMDGRKTEARLRQFFELVPESAAQHEEMMGALRKYLGGFDREPSKVARISIPKTPAAQAVKESVPDLIVRLIKALDPAQQAEVIEALG
jgi:hypothetical protein